jgi:hypothetical protein
MDRGIKKATTHQERHDVSGQHGDDSVVEGHERPEVLLVLQEL